MMTKGLCHKCFDSNVETTVQNGEPVCRRCKK